MYWVIKYASVVLFGRRIYSSTLLRYLFPKSYVDKVSFRIANGRKNTFLKRKLERLELCINSCG